MLLKTGLNISGKYEIFVVVYMAHKQTCRISHSLINQTVYTGGDKASSAKGWSCEAKEARRRFVALFINGMFVERPIPRYYTGPTVYSIPGQRYLNNHDFEPLVPPWIMTGTQYYSIQSEIALNIIQSL